MKTIETQRGNIIVLILVAVALFAGLTFTLSNSMQGGSSDELSEAQATLYANQLMTYMSEADSAVSQMIFNGASVADIDTVDPSDPTFETGSDIYKLFHVDGGGLNYRPPKSPPFIDGAGFWLPMNYLQYEWTPTTAPEVSLVAMGIERPVCEEVNKKLTGSTTIPVAGAFGGALTTAECPACDGYPSLCVDYSAVAGIEFYFFYTILAAQ